MLTDQLKTATNPATMPQENQPSDHPIMPGSAEDYLQQCRAELEYNSKLAEEMEVATASVCRPLSEQKTAGSETRPSPASPLADALAHMANRLERNNEILRDVLRRFDLP